MVITLILVHFKRLRCRVFVFHNSFNSYIFFLFKTYVHSENKFMREFDKIFERSFLNHDVIL